MTNFFLRTTMMIAIITIFGRLLSFFRNIFLTNEFGVGVETDAYLMAFTLPLTLFLILPGAVNSVLVPTFKGISDAADQARRDELFHKLLSLTACLFLIITVLGMIWAKELVSVLAPGFSAEKQVLTAELLRVMLPSALFIGMIAVMSSVLNAHYRFFEPTIGTVINGLIVIISIYTVAPMLGIHGVAWGTTAGYLLFALYLIRPLRKHSYTLRWNVSMRNDAQLRSMGERFIPIVFGMLITQLYLIVERIIGSGLGDQKITTLVLAQGIIQLPLAIFAGALAIPLFPLLAEYVKKNQMERMKETLSKGMLYQVHMLLPATLGFILCAGPFVRFFYDYSSSFTDSDVSLTAWAMIFYSFSMLGIAGRDMLTRASYAIENTKTPVIIGAVSLAIYVLLSLWLVKPLDHGGLALAFSLANLLNMMLQSWFLRRQIGRIYERAFYVSIGRGLLAVIVMSVGVWFLQSWTMDWGKLQIPVIIVVAAILYGGMLWLLKEKLLKELVFSLVNRSRTGGGASGI